MRRRRAPIRYFRPHAPAFGCAVRGARRGHGRRERRLFRFYRNTARGARARRSGVDRIALPRAPRRTGRLLVGARLCRGAEGAAACRGKRAARRPGAAALGRAAGDAGPPAGLGPRASQAVRRHRPHRRGGGIALPRLACLGRREPDGQPLSPRPASADRLRRAHRDARSISGIAELRQPGGLRPRRVSPPAGHPYQRGRASADAHPAARKPASRFTASLRPTRTQRASRTIRRFMGRKPLRADSAGAAARRQLPAGRRDDDRLSTNGRLSCAGDFRTAHRLAGIRSVGNPAARRRASLPARGGGDSGRRRLRRPGGSEAARHPRGDDVRGVSGRVADLSAEAGAQRHRRGRLRFPARQAGTAYGRRVPDVVPGRCADRGNRRSPAGADDRALPPRAARHRQPGPRPVPRRERRRETRRAAQLVGAAQAIGAVAAEADYGCFQRRAEPAVLGRRPGVDFGSHATRHGAADGCLLSARFIQRGVRQSVPDAGAGFHHTLRTDRPCRQLGVAGRGRIPRRGLDARLDGRAGRIPASVPARASAAGLARGAVVGGFGRMGLVAAPRGEPRLAGSNTGRRACRRVVHPSFSAANRCRPPGADGARRGAGRIFVRCLSRRPGRS